MFDGSFIVLSRFNFKFLSEYKNTSCKLFYMRNNYNI